MCHSRQLNNRINLIHKRVLRHVYQDQRSFFWQLLKKEKKWKKKKKKKIKHWSEAATQRCSVRKVNIEISQNSQKNTILTEHLRTIFEG